MLILSHFPHFWMTECFMPHTSNIFHPWHFNASQTFSMRKQQDKDSLLIPPQNLQPTCAYAQMIPLAETHKPLIQSKVCSSTSARTSSTLTLQALSVSSFCCHINRFRMSLVVPSVYKWVLIMLILKKKQANKPHYNLTVSFIHPFPLTVKRKVFWVIFLTFHFLVSH